MVRVRMKWIGGERRYLIPITHSIVVKLPKVGVYIFPKIFHPIFILMPKLIEKIGEHISNLFASSINPVVVGVSVFCFSNL